MAGLALLASTCRRKEAQSISGLRVLPFLPFLSQKTPGTALTPAYLITAMHSTKLVCLDFPIVTVLYCDVAFTCGLD